MIEPEDPEQKPGGLRSELPYIILAPFTMITGVAVLYVFVMGLLYALEFIGERQWLALPLLLLWILFFGGMFIWLGARVFRGPWWRK